MNLHPEPPTAAPSKLRLQYDQLCRSVEIPDDEFNVAVQFLQKLEEVASTKMSTCKLYMFRTWHLKLRNPGGGNELLLFLDTQGFISGQTHFIANLPYAQVLKDVFSTDAKAELLQLGMEFRGRSKNEVGKQGPEFLCSHLASGTQFTIWPEKHPWLVEEVQACRMLEYLVTFDIRVKPLYTLISYWTNVNNIQLSHMEQHIDATPEPAPLEWLIMLFLCHKKIVPTPRDILERESSRRTPIIRDGIDMGFFPDPKFAAGQRQSSRDSLPLEETDDFILSILELMEGFFSFYVGLSSGSWILNTRDGEIIRSKDFVNDTPGITNLTAPERETIGKLGRGFRLATALREPAFLAFLHPLHLQQRFAFDHQVFIKNVIPVMKATANKLQQFVQDESYRDEVLTSGANNLKYLFHEK